MTKLEAQLEKYLMHGPTFGKGVYLAPGAVVIGDVTLGDQASVWCNAVLRGDINRIAIGEGSNIQDNSVVHLADDYPCVVGRHVTVGHSVVLHACTVEDECLIGMGSTLLDGVVVGHHSIVGANSLVKQGMVIPPGSLVLGSPARVVRALTEAEQRKLKGMALKYVKLSAYYLKNKLSATTQNVPGNQPDEN